MPGAASKAPGGGYEAAGADVRRVATPERRSAPNPTLVAAATSCHYLLRQQQQAGRLRRLAVHGRVAVGGLLHVLWGSNDRWLSAPYLRRGFAFPSPLWRCMSVRVATACCGSSSKQAGRQRRPTVHWRGDIGGLLQVLRALLRLVAVGATPSPRHRPCLPPAPLPRYLSFCQCRAACALLLA